MNSKLKRKWVSALNGGRYRQGKNRLMENGKYCCLGVLRSVNDPADFRKRNFCEFLTVDQLKEFGLTHQIQLDLADLNDNEIPFTVIAGFINENL